MKAKIEQMLHLLYGEENTQEAAVTENKGVTEIIREQDELSSVYYILGFL